MVAVSPGIQTYSVGDLVCALCNGGGYAEYTSVPASQCLPVPVLLVFCFTSPNCACTTDDSNDLVDTGWTVGYFGVSGERGSAYFPFSFLRF